MIFVRWCIPDIHPKLRDKIRRETYITNEIIIQQEALRARESSANDVETNQHITLNENTNRWNRVIRNSLSNSEFDLEVHGSPVSPTSTHSRVGPAAL